MIRRIKFGLKKKIRGFGRLPRLLSYILVSDILDLEHQARYDEKLKMMVISVLIVTLVQFVGAYKLLLNRGHVVGSKRMLIDQSLMKYGGCQFQHSHWSSSLPFQAQTGERTKEDFISQFPVTSDPRSIGLVLAGQSAVLIFAILLGALFSIDPVCKLALDFSISNLAKGFGIGSFLALLGALFDRLPWDFSQKIRRDTKIYTLMLLGREFPIFKAFSLSFVISLAAGVSEELLFRGVLFPAFSPYLGQIYSLFLSSAMFGLAHVASFGPGSLLESLLGAAFGWSLLFAKGNLIVPIVVHTVYDLWTLFFTWLDASQEITGFTKRKKMYQEYRDAVLRKVNQNITDREEYTNNILSAIFSIIDTNQDGKLNEKGIYQALKLLGLDWNPYPVVKASGLSMSDRARLLMKSMDLNQDGSVSYGEFMQAMNESYRV